jgi:hypothetical protein
MKTLNAGFPGGRLPFSITAADILHFELGALHLALASSTSAGREPQVSFFTVPASSSPGYAPSTAAFDASRPPLVFSGEVTALESFVSADYESALCFIAETSRLPGETAVAVGRLYVVNMHDVQTQV